MAIFGKNRPQQGAGHGATIIAAGTQLVGNLSLSDRLHVDGRVDGDVQSESGVVVGTEGVIEGTVKADEVVVSGRIQGSISANRLEIIAGGTVEGDVHTVNLVIEPGGRFNGSSEILAAGQSSKAKKEPAEPARARRERDAAQPADTESSPAT